MKFLIVKTLFCPTDKYFNMTIKSLIKTNMYLKFLKNSNFKFDLLLVGWAHKYVSHIRYIIKTYNLIFINIFSEFWPINYGKYKMFNYCMDFAKLYMDNDYIIFMDHDVHFDFISSKYFDEIVAIIDAKIDDKEIGLIAFNQKNDNRHQPTIYKNTYNLNRNIIVWPNDNCSIAIGCFVIKSRIFASLVKFSVNVVYGLDDYELCKQLSDNGYLNVVTKNCFIIHPFDDNKKYEEWKKNNIIRLIDGKPINYYQNIEESMNILLN